jgi:hypothetical protein
VVSYIIWTFESVMARKTKEELKKARSEKRISDLIQNVKWLRDSKFYATNFWSIAHWDSWARQGKAGSCSCGAGYYSGSLCNKRRHTKPGGRPEHCRHVVEKLCDECIKGIETRLNIQFKRDYAP